MTAIGNSPGPSFNAANAGPTPSQMPAGASIDTVALPAMAQVGQNIANLSPTQKMEDLINNGKEEYNESVERAINEKIDEAVNLAPKRLLTSLDNLLRFVCELGIHYTKMRDLALDKLILLLEREPMTPESAEAIRKLVDSLVKSLDRNQIQGKAFEYQKKIARAFYLAIEHYLALYAQKHLGAITKELKDQLLKIVNDLDALNKHGDIQLKNTSEMSRESIKRMEDDSSTAAEVLDAVIMLAEGVGGLFNKDPSPLAKNVSKLVSNLRAKRTSSWYDTYLAAKLISQKALVDMDCYSRLLEVMSVTLPCKEKNLAISYAELLTYVARHTRDPRLKTAIVDSRPLQDTAKAAERPHVQITGLCSFLLMKEDKDVRYRAAQLLIDFLRSEDPVIVRMTEAHLLLMYHNTRQHPYFAHDTALYKLLSSLNIGDFQRRFRLPLPKNGSNSAGDASQHSQQQFQSKVAAALSVSSDVVLVSPSSSVTVVLKTDAISPNFHEDPMSPSNNVSDMDKTERENKMTQSVASFVFGSVVPLQDPLPPKPTAETPIVQPSSNALSLQAASASGQLPAGYDPVQSQMQFETKVARSKEEERETNDSDEILISDIETFPGGEEFVEPYLDRELNSEERALLKGWLKDANLLAVCRKEMQISKKFENLRKEGIPQAQLAQEARKLFASSQDIESLMVTHAGLTEIPPEICQLRNLKSLYLDCNRIRTLIPEIGQLKALRLLKLSDNQIEALPPEIVQLQNLEDLGLNNNRIRSLIPEIGQLKALRFLKLSNNQIEALIPELGQLQNLVMLDLENNRLKTLIPEIGQLQKLKDLNVGNNQIVAFIPEVGLLQNLEKLNLNFNRITAFIPQIGKLTKLRLLLVRNNQIKTLSESSQLSRLPNLQHLDLRSNPVRQIPAFLQSKKKQISMDK